MRRKLKRVLGAAPLFLCALTFCPRLTHAAKTSRTYQVFQIKEGLFRCEIPSAWEQLRDPDKENRYRAYGIFLAGPSDAQGASAHMDVHYYAPGNILFKGSAAYLKRQFDPGLISIPGEKAGPIQPAALGKLKGKKFERDTFVFLPPESADPKKIGVHEEQMILNRTGGQGFYVLTYSAPKNLFKRYRANFQHLLDTFQPTTP